MIMITDDDLCRLVPMNRKKLVVDLRFWIVGEVQRIFHKTGAWGNPKPVVDLYTPDTLERLLRHYRPKDVKPPQHYVVDSTA